MTAELGEGMHGFLWMVGRFCSEALRAIFEVQVVALEDQVLIRLVMMASMVS